MWRTLSSVRGMGFGACRLFAPVLFWLVYIIYLRVIFVICKVKRITYRIKSDSIYEDNIKMLNNLYYSTIAFSYDCKVLDSFF